MSFLFSLRQGLTLYVRLSLNFSLTHAEITDGEPLGLDVGGGLFKFLGAFSWGKTLFQFLFFVCVGVFGGRCWV